MGILSPLLLCAMIVGASMLSGVAPVPADSTPPPLYFPTIKGSKWVYQTEENERVEVILDVKEKSGEKLVTVGYQVRDKQPSPAHTVAVSGKGLCLVNTTVATLDEPFWLLKLPQPQNTKWDAVLAVSGIGREVGKMTATGPERVEVPAGTFQAIRVDLDINLGKRLRKTCWYAPGVGKVKEVVGDSVEVLKSYTVGKQ